MKIRSNWGVLGLWRYCGGVNVVRVTVGCLGVCALVRNKTVSGERLSSAVKYGGSAACRVAVFERADDLSDEILRAIASEEIFAMCRGVKVDADVAEAARAELERRCTAVGE